MMSLNMPKFTVVTPQPQQEIETVSPLQQACNMLTRMGKPLDGILVVVSATSTTKRTSIWTICDGKPIKGASRIVKK